MTALLIIRHAQAKSKDEDPERGLNDTGVAQAEKLGAHLKEKGVTVATTWHSGKKRARATAEIVAGVLGVPAPVARDGLSPNDPIVPIADLIETENEPLMLVGHLPFVSRLVGYLTTGKDEAIIDFGEAAAAYLERDDDGRWHLAWQFDPTTS